MINKSNYHIINRNESIINLIDITIDYLEINICNLKTNVKRYFNYIFEYSNIKFSDIRNIIKSFNKEQYYLTISLLKDLRKKIVNQTKFYLRN